MDKSVPASKTGKTPERKVRIRKKGRWLQSKARSSHVVCLCVFVSARAALDAGTCAREEGRETSDTP